MKLTPAQRTALNMLALDKEGASHDLHGLGQIYDGHGVSLSTVRVLEKLGLVTLKVYTQRGEYYYNSFARTNLHARDSRHWTATITEHGLSAAKELRPTAPVDL